MLRTRLHFISTVDSVTRQVDKRGGASRGHQTRCVFLGVINGANAISECAAGGVNLRIITLLCVLYSPYAVHKPRRGVKREAFTVAGLCRKYDLPYHFFTLFRL